MFESCEHASCSHIVFTGQALFFFLLLCVHVCVFSSKAGSQSLLCLTSTVCYSCVCFIPFQLQVVVWLAPSVALVSLYSNWMNFTCASTVCGFIWIPTPPSPTQRSAQSKLVCCKQVDRDSGKQACDLTLRALCFAGGQGTHARTPRTQHTRHAHQQVSQFCDPAGAERSCHSVTSRGRR